MFWIIANIEGAIVSRFVPRFINHPFSFNTGISDMVRRGVINPLYLYTIVQVLLFVLVSTFTGASHFSKSPLVKTIFTFSGIFFSYLLLVYILVKALNLPAYNLMKGGIIIPKNDDDITIILGVWATVINLTLISIAWFRFKEKEA
jgi:hypothetical protein